MQSKLTYVRVSPRWHPKFGVINITSYHYLSARMEMLLMDSNRWVVSGLFIITVLAAMPFLFTFLGIGWAQRGMQAGLGRFTSSHWILRVHQ